MAAKRDRDKVESPAVSPEGGRQLGLYLSNMRSVKKLTLREVEEATDRKVSNAYLSQLETGKISRPSPNVLHALANVYGVPYETLMEKAGYITPSQSGSTSVLRSGRGAKRQSASALASQDVTEDEEVKLLEYLAFLRSKQHGKR